MNLSQRFIFFQKRFATGIASLALPIPLFAKNSRLGYFFNANNLTQTRLQIQSPDLRLEALIVRYQICQGKFSFLVESLHGE
jgi:hypothetical protein